MKLNELAVHRPTQQVSKVFENFFDQRVNFDHMPRSAARGMLRKVHALVQEHRASRDFHHSEQNPAYLKLVVMEQALATQAVATPGTVTTDPRKLAALQSAKMAQQKRTAQDQMRQIDKQKADLDKQKSELQKQTRK